MKKITKTIFWIIGIFISFNIISISLFPSISIISFSKTNTFPINKIIIFESYKILYSGISDSFGSPQASVKICPANTNYPNNYGNGCSWDLENTGTTYDNLIPNVTILFNSDNFKIIEKGFYFFGNKVGT